MLLLDKEDCATTRMATLAKGTQYECGHSFACRIPKSNNLIRLCSPSEPSLLARKSPKMLTLLRGIAVYSAGR